MRLRYISKTSQNKVSEPGFRSLMQLFGFVPISDEEYLEKLRRSREIYLRRIAVLEKQIEDEKLMKNPPNEAGP